MGLHPGPEKRCVPEVRPAGLDPIQRAFQENEDWYQDQVEHSQDLLCIHDLEGRLLSVDPAPARVLGYSVEEILQIPMRELIAPESRPQFDAYLSQIAISGESRGLMAVMTRSGERRIWEYHNTLRTEGEASPIVRAIAHDITEQKRAEKLAREAKEELLHRVGEGERTIRELKLFRTLVDQSNDAIEVVDPETLCFLDVNEKACAELGYSREELLSLRVFDIDPAVNESSAAEITEELRRSGSLVIESLYRRKDGSTFPVEVSMRRVHLERDYVVAIARDLTERKQAEARLQASENRYRALHDGSPVGVCWVETRTGRFLGVNPKYCEIAGRPEQELLGRNFQSITHPDDLAENLEKLRQLVSGEVRHYEMEKRYLRPDGSIRWVEAGVVAMWPEGETPVWHMAIVQDITERKQAQEALRRSEENYRNFVSQISEGIFREDLDNPVPIDLSEDELVHHILYESHIVECNDALAAMYGLKSGDELRGKRLTEILPPEDPRNIELTRQFIRSGFRLLEHESHELDRHGNPKVVLNSMIGTVEDGKLARTWGIAWDITERVKLEEFRRKAEEALRENVAQLQEVTEELRQAKEKLSEEKLYLEEAIDTELGFGEIIGHSSALKDVMAKVAKVAPSDATVLLLGETGTGKELVARALHRMSSREGNSFIKLNCAAIPSGLLESELFGHEKGAFTGAVARKLGRLELADRGTLFLDEIGEIPLSLQPKLLRVLQDMEFERLGGTQTLKVNFRLLAATNRDLPQSVKAREFRSDLYYRLNVFPILIPPLRERCEDIRPLIEHFVHKFANQMKKSITSIPSRTMEMLVRWEWPGNIRELENFVERSVILTPGSVLQAPLSELQTPVQEDSGGDKGSLGAKERERILRTLRECHGRLGGPDGAAARLGLKRTTLQSKLDQLGIKAGMYRT
jgi:formate hydrogenlyase transcriptional activator